MPRSIDSLPEEVLRIIVRQLSLKSFCNASTLSKRWHGVARAELFSEIELSRRDAENVLALYGALFTSQKGRQPVLAGAHIQKMSYSFIEDFLDQEEFAEKESLARKIIHSLKGISVLELELSLVNEATAIFKDTLLPGIKSFLDLIKDKVDSIDLTIDAIDGMDVALAEEDEDAGSEADNDIAMKLSAISEAFPVDKVRSIHLTEVQPRQLPPAFARLFTSSTLRDVSLQDCGDAFNSLPPVSNLSKLAVSWALHDSCSLKTALSICMSSAETLRTLQLQNIMRENNSFLAETLPSNVVLPQLRHLQIGDNHFGLGSLLDKVLSCTQLPSLEKLTLETDDILDCGAEFAERLPKMDTLRKIVFVEGSPRRELTSTPDQADFQTFVDMCTSRETNIECRVSPRCDTPEKVALAFERMRILSSFLVEVSLNLQSDSLFNVDQLPILDLPHMQRMQVAVSDITTVGQDRVNSNGASRSTIGELLKHIQAPKLKSLQATIFTTEDAACDNLESVKQTIMDGLYANLERITGTAMAAAGMSQEYQEDYLREFTQTCENRGIDGSGMTFISSTDLLGDFVHEDDDESIASDDDESGEGEDDEDDDQPESDSGESGYGEDASLIRPAGRREIDDDDSASDSAFSSHSLRSADSDNSWMTDSDV